MPEEFIPSSGECEVSPDIYLAHPPAMHPASEARLNRRDLLRKAAGTTAALSAMDFLAAMQAEGAPRLGAKNEARLKDMAQEGDDPHFLIYWYIEGGWESFDMFSPLLTANNVVHRLPYSQISDEMYRVLHFGEANYGIYKQGGIRYGYLAEGGKNLMPEMAVLSSMSTGEFHSGERLNCHMGHYNYNLTDDRQPDERDVMQAFAEVYGRPYVLPNIGWFWWLSDGELNEQQYTGRKGFYANLGPRWAHTIYAGTPANLKSFLLRMQAVSTNPINQQVDAFLNNVSPEFIKDSHMDAVKSYQSALGIYQNLAGAGRNLSHDMLENLFVNPVLKEKFQIKPEDELITYTSVNNNKARTKFTPATNVQAMMAYELMRAGLSTCFFIETRNIRQFDSHRGRSSLWSPDGKTPYGQTDQLQWMNEQMWQPLNTLVELLKATPYKNTGKSLWDFTHIVLTSEFGRTISGDVAGIQSMNIPMDKKVDQINGQDISQHWHVTGAAFLGPNVRGNTQWGGVGSVTHLPIPLKADGTMDTAFHPVTGVQIPGRTPSGSWLPDHGDVYATALALSGINPKGHGRNERPPMTYIMRNTV